MTPPTVAAIRLALGAAVLAVVRARRWAMPRGWSWWSHFFVVGLFGSALPFTMLAWAEQYVSSALTAVLNASTPLFAAVMAGILLGDRLRAVQIGGLLLGTRAAAVTYLIPIVAVTVGVVFLHEPFSIRIVVGGLLTIAGIAILGVRRPPAPRDPLSAPHA